MHVCWNLYRFDYVRFTALRPHLRAATTPEALAALNDSEAFIALSEEYAAGVLSLAEARNGALQLLCCEGEPLAFDHTLPTFLASLARRKRAEEAGELLANMLTSAPNLEPGWQCIGGLIGFLTPQETASVFEALSIASRQRGRKRKGRSGGLLGRVIAFVSNLIAAGPQEEDTLRLLVQFLRDAADNEQGIALVVN